MPLLEREAELAALAGFIADAAKANGRVVLVGGEAGVGKSALVREACESAPASTRVLWGHCDPLATPRPLGPIVDMAGTPGSGLPPVPTGVARHEACQAFLDALRERKATVAVIEDAHWADEATLDLLSYLSRRIAETSTAVIVTYRDDELGGSHPLRMLLGDLTSVPAVRRLRVEPLSRTAVTALAEPAGADPDRIWDLSAGNAFIATELLECGGEDMPASARDAVLARAGRLSASGHRALDTAAIVPGGAEIEVIRRATGDAGVDDCTAKGLLIAVGTHVEFRHELARMIVEEAIPPARRAVLHRDVFHAMIDLGRVDASRLAHHAEAAGDRDGVVRYATEAADEAIAVGAHREAAAQLGRALRWATGLPPDARAELLEKRADECRVTDEVGEAVACLEEALACWTRVGDRRRRGNCLRRLGQAMRDTDRAPEGVTVVADAVALLEEDGDSPELAMALAAQAQALMVNDLAEPAIAVGRRAIELAERLDETRAHIHALNSVGVARVYSDDEGGFDDLYESLVRARVAGHDEEVVRALNNLCHLLALERRIEEGVELIAEAIALATDRQLVSFFQCMRGSEAELYLHAGRWDDAVEVVHSVMARTDTATTHRPGPLAVLGKVRARRGDPDPWGPLEEGLHYARVMGEPQNIHPVRMGMVEAAWFAGDLDRARAELVDHLPMAVQMRHRWSHGEVARWALRLGLDDLPPMVVPKAYEPLLAGDPSGTAAAFAAKHCPYDEADALLDSDDVGDLRRALVLFDQLGAKPPMAIASQRLRARGVRRLPRRARPSTRGNPAGLTAREVEVAGLLAEHLTNEQIASRLYLSVKTVDHHVSAVLSKLGVRTRREAARRLAELGGC